jgi:hypothetical protein
MFCPDFSTTTTFVSNQSDAFVFYYDSTTNNLSNGDKTTLTIEGAQNINAIPSAAGIVLQVIPFAGWVGYFPVETQNGSTVLGSANNNVSLSSAQSNSNYLFAFVSAS